MKGAHPDEPVSTEARRARFATPNGLGTPGPSAGDTEVEVTEAAGRRRRVLVDIAVWHQKDARLVWCACPDSSSHFSFDHSGVGFRDWQGTSHSLNFDVDFLGQGWMRDSIVQVGHEPAYLVVIRGRTF